jgi:sulfur-oxidizing protein SoxZ
MKLRTRTQEGQVELLVLINHPMETGQRTDTATKEKIPAHFIQHVAVALNGKTVATADLSTAISENPLLGFRLKDAKEGDMLKVTWDDNQGEKGEMEKAVSL